MQNFAPCGFSAEQFWQRTGLSRAKRLAPLVSPGAGKGQRAAGSGSVCFQLIDKPVNVAEYPHLGNPIAAKLEDGSAGILDAPPGWRDAKKLSAMGALPGKPGERLIPFGNDFLDHAREIREGSLDKINVLAEFVTAALGFSERATKTEIICEKICDDRLIEAVPHFVVKGVNQ